MAEPDFKTCRGGYRGGPGYGEKLPRSTAPPIRLPNSLLSITLLILLLVFTGLFVSPVPPSLVAATNVVRVVVECYTDEDGRKTCDAHLPVNERVRREFRRNVGEDSETWFTVDMCTTFEASLYSGEEGFLAQQYLYDTMTEVQALLEERHGPISGLRGRAVGANWGDFPPALEAESGVWPLEKPDGSDPEAALRAGMYAFECSEGPPLKCLLKFPPAAVHKTPYERTNISGETMTFTLVWGNDFNQRLVGEDTPAEELVDYVLEYLLWLWNRAELQEGIHAYYIYVPEGVRAYDHGRQIDFEPFRQLYRVGLSFWCGGFTSEGRRCDVDLPPFTRVQEVMKLDEGTPGEMLFNIRMGCELRNYLNGEEEQRILARETLRDLMVTIRDIIVARYGSVEGLTVEVGGSDWLDWPGPLHSDLGEHPADVPDPEEGPDRAVRLGRYVYRCRPGPPAMMCFLTLPLTSRVGREFIRNQDTEDQVRFRLFWDKEFQALLSDASVFSPGHLLLEHVMDAILYEWRFYDWRFTRTGVEPVRYGDEVDLRIRDLQQGMQGVIYIPLPGSIQPDQLGSSIVMREVEGEGTVIG